MKELFILLLLVFNLEANNIEKAKLDLTIVDLIPNQKDTIFQTIIRKNYNLIEKNELKKYASNIKIKEYNFNLEKSVKTKNGNISVFLGQNRASDLTNLIIYDKIENDGVFEKIRYVLDLKPEMYYYYELNYQIEDKEYKRIYQFKLEKINENIFSF